MKNFPKFLYLTNLFRLAVYFSKLISIFSKKEKKRTSFYNFFKKRKSHFDKDLLKILYKPKIFILNHDFETKNIINSIYNYENLFDVNEFTDRTVPRTGVPNFDNVFKSDCPINPVAPVIKIFFFIYYLEKNCFKREMIL